MKGDRDYECIFGFNAISFFFRVVSDVFVSDDDEVENFLTVPF